MIGLLADIGLTTTYQWYEVLCGLAESGIKRREVSVMVVKQMQTDVLVIGKQAG